MTDEKTNTEDQSNMEEQSTNESVETSTEQVDMTTNVENEPVAENTATDSVETEEAVVETPNVEETAPVAEEVATSDEEVETTTEVEDSVAEEQEAPASVVEEAVIVPPPAPKKEKKVDNGKRWYSLRVISGKERKIKERIELEIQRSGWTDFITQILVPTEKVYKIRQGKKVISERNILPGYILVEALAKNFTGEMVQAITGMPNVIHFLGRNNPIPMQQSEANRMLGKVDESQDVGESLLEPFIVGETVKIIDGPFNEFVGDIQEINDEKKKLKVIVKIFGRGTEVELNFIQVEKQA